MNANCSNSEGSYQCECTTGFQGDGFSCIGKLILSISFLNEMSLPSYRVGEINSGF